MVVASKHTVEVPEIPLHYVMLSRFAEHGDHVGLVDGITGREYTFNQLEEISRRVASGLVRHGVKKGDLMAIYLANSPEFFLMYFACLRLGVTVSPANPVYTAYEFTHHLTDCRAQYVFAMKGNYKQVEEACRKAPFVKKLFLLGSGAGGIDFDTLLSDNGDLHTEDVDIDAKNDVAVVPYSSGTTGLPKGVMLTHYNIVANFLQASHGSSTAEADQEDPYAISFLAVLPFFHVYGLLVILTAMLTFGAKIVTLPRFIPDQFLAAVQKYKITTLPLVPPLVIYLAKSPLVGKYDTSSVIKVVCGAAALSKETANSFRSRFKVPDLKQGYGMTETTFVATVPPPDSDIQGSVGSLVAGTEARIVDPESGRDLSLGERGEIWLRGPQIMKGYLNNPEATKNTLDSDGWLRTGDIGYYDKDEYFYITGRLKELIKYKGFQVPPAELEALLLQHPGVTEVAVIGVPDAAAGELPRAFIIKTDNMDVTKVELDKFVKERMTSYKWLRGGIQFVDHIPKTPSGKIIRREVAKLMPNKSKL